MGHQLYDRVRRIIESARARAARSVDTAQVLSNWLIGREIVEEEQRGEKRAAYGRRLLEKLSARLSTEYGGGYSVRNLRYSRQFFIVFPGLLGTEPIRQPLVGELGDPAETPAIRQPPVAESWRPGLLSTSLCWRHYLALIRVDARAKRDFYEIEAVKNSWSGRELERQINSLLYERLALSKDKADVMELATKGQEIAKPGDVFKDPLILDFLGVPVVSKLTEVVKAFSVKCAFKASFQCATMSSRGFEGDEPSAKLPRPVQGAKEATSGARVLAWTRAFSFPGSPPGGVYEG